MVIIDPFVKKLVQTSEKSLLIDYDDQRPWGGWWLFEDGVNERNFAFDRKILKVSSSSRLNILSLQFHGSELNPGHSEKWIAHTDAVVLVGRKSVIGLSEQELKFEIESINVLKLSAGQEIIIPDGYLHALANPWSTKDVYIEETRFSPVGLIQSYQDRENNITRIFDQTGRQGLPDYPLSLQEKIKAVS